ncbi:MAG: hypothetical protein FJ278_02770 [Planctomycetes bacterium]|nr:hypothetical protein [Planctomycetota bacterium]
MSRNAADILRELRGIVKRIERDAAGVASVLGRMIELQERRQVQPGQDKGAVEIAAPKPS